MRRLEPTDAIALVGVALLTVGSALAWIPLGFIVPGSLLLIYAVRSARAETTT